MDEEDQDQSERENSIRKSSQMQLRKEISMSLRWPLTNENGEENASRNMVYDIFFSELRFVCVIVKSILISAFPMHKSL